MNPHSHLLFGSAFRGSKLTSILKRYDWGFWMSRVLSMLSMGVVISRHKDPYRTTYSPGMTAGFWKIRV